MFKLERKEEAVAEGDANDDFAFRMGATMSMRGTLSATADSSSLTREEQVIKQRMMKRVSEFYAGMEVDSAALLDITSPGTPQHFLAGRAAHLWKKHNESFTNEFKLWTEQYPRWVSTHSILLEPWSLRVKWDKNVYPEKKDPPLPPSKRTVPAKTSRPPLPTALKPSAPLSYSTLPLLPDEIE